MDSMRRALLLLLLVSVAMTEPTQARVPGAEREVASTAATARWIQHLATTLRRTVKPAAITPPSWHKFKSVLPTFIEADAQVIAAHPAREPHAFRLPPPTK